MILRFYSQENYQFIFYILLFALIYTLLFKKFFTSYVCLLSEIFSETNYQ